MSKVTVVYYSSTGNTEMMAEAIAKGAKETGAEVSVFSVSDATKECVEGADCVLLGCSAMGAEELEEAEFRPFFESITDIIKDKKVALFGSYGWGTGEWMESWESECASKGIALAGKSLIVNETPDGDALAECEAFGKSLA